MTIREGIVILNFIEIRSATLDIKQANGQVQPSNYSFILCAF